MRPIDLLDPIPGIAPYDREYDRDYEYVRNMLIKAHYSVLDNNISKREFDRRKEKILTSNKKPCGIERNLMMRQKLQQKLYEKQQQQIKN